MDSDTAPLTGKHGKEDNSSIFDEVINRKNSNSMKRIMIMNACH